MKLFKTGIFFCFLGITSCCVIDPCYCEDGDLFYDTCEETPEVFFNPPEWIIGTWSNKEAGQEISTFIFTPDNVLLINDNDNIINLSNNGDEVIEDRNDFDVYEFSLRGNQDISPFSYTFIQVSDSVMKYFDSGDAEFYFLKD